MAAALGKTRYGRTDWNQIVKGIVFGSNGQVGRELARLAPDFKHLNRADVDLETPQSCEDVINTFQPEIVMNAAAYTAVDAAEDNRSVALVVNADAPAAMARAAKRIGAAFIQISTDYVFDGSGLTPWRETDPTGPLGVYGSTKLVGEEKVQSVGGRYAILRTSWVFSKHGTNFVKTMLRLSESKQALSIVNDQIGGPTSAASIASASLRVARMMLEDPTTSGIYHYAGAPTVSWADFATEIFRQAGKSVEVTPIPSHLYPTIAKRPLNSRLDCSKIQRVFGISQPDWRADLGDVLNGLEAAHET